MCEHTSFHAEAHVVRLVDDRDGSVTFPAEFSLICVGCGVPFEFCDGGQSVNFDGTVMKSAIVPSRVIVVTQ